jgi:hypothetical protein
MPSDIEDFPHNGAGPKEDATTHETPADLYTGNGAVLLDIGSKNTDQGEASVLKLANDRHVCQIMHNREDDIGKPYSLLTIFRPFWYPSRPRTQMIPLTGPGRKSI